MNLPQIAKMFLFFLALLGPKIALGKVYDYVQYQDPDNFALAGSSSRIDTDKRLLFGTHDSSSVVICKPDEKFHCLYGNIFNFAVPKQSLSVGKKWIYHQFAYEVVGRKELSLAGQRIEVCIISGKQIGSVKRRLPYVNTYYYSEERGLIGIKAYYPNTRYGYFLLVSGETGFPN